MLWGGMKLKIALLGPVITKSYYGGVATFDEGLAEAFLELGHEVILFTVQKDIPLNKIIPIERKSKYSLASSVNDYHPDIVIASLQYGLYFTRIQNSKKILFIHGFFNFESYGVLKTLISVMVTKFMARYSDLLVANSNFTAMINRRIWNIPVDCIAYLGADNQFLSHVDKVKSIKKKKGQILFAGRLAVSKKVEKIIHAVSLLNNQDIIYELVVAGDGPEYRNLKNYAAKCGANTKFLGKVSHENIFDLYSESEVFISLGESEPFGITFVEALLSGCKIVCPNTGGQVEFLSSYPDKVCFVDPLNPQDIAVGIQRLLEENTEEIDVDNLVERFNYKNTAKKIISFCEKNLNNR